MDIIETINTRKSVRSFKPDPIPKKMLTQLMEEAIKAPSWGNSQPWEFAIVSGRKLQEIKKGILEKVDEEQTMEIARPQTFPELYSSRMQALGKRSWKLWG